MKMEAGWRELEVGEMTRNGDEYLSDWDRTWQSVECIGETINEDHVEFRRKVTKPSVNECVEYARDGNGADRAKDLAEAHWQFIHDLMMAMPTVEQGDIDIAAFHYQSAFIHGYKHAQEDADV